MARQHNPEVSFLIKLAEYNEKKVVEISWSDFLYSVFLTSPAGQRRGSYETSLFPVRHPGRSEAESRDPEIPGFRVKPGMTG